MKRLLMWLCLAMTVFTFGCGGGNSDSLETASLTSDPVAVINNQYSVKSVEVNSLVTLDGNESYVIDGNDVFCSWSLTEKPAGSQSILINPTSVNPSFIPDLPGEYILELIVSDGVGQSSPFDNCSACYQLES